MINKGYLEAKSTKESDEVFTPEEAVYPILSFLNLYCKKNNIEKKILLYGVLLIKKKAIM